MLNTNIPQKRTVVSRYLLSACVAIQCFAGAADIAIAQDELPAVALRLQLATQRRLKL